MRLFLCLIFALSLFPRFSHASESDTYNFTWLDPDKEVYVLQNRKFRKVGRLHLNAGYGVTTSGPFVDATTMQVRLGYFFSEDWGVEGIYAKNDGKENDNALAVRNGQGNGTTPFRRIVNSYMGGMLLWSPFYTKINTFNSIFYLDWLFGLGLAQLEEKNNQNEIKDFGQDETAVVETHTGLIWNVGLQAYLSESWALRLDMTSVVYKAKLASTTSATTEEGTTSNWDVALSLGYRF
jgi:outer membrane beta-barrel protein